MITIRRLLEAASYTDDYPVITAAVMAHCDLKSRRAAPPAVLFLAIRYPNGTCLFPETKNSGLPAIPIWINATYPVLDDNLTRCLSAPIGPQQMCAQLFATLGVARFVQHRLQFCSP